MTSQNQAYKLTEVFAKVEGDLWQNTGEGRPWPRMEEVVP